MIIIHVYIAHYPPKDAQGACIIITLAIAPETSFRTVHLKEEIPTGYPILLSG